MLKRFNDKSDKPAKAIPQNELNQIKTPVYLILGDKDLLFPCKDVVRIAQKEIKSMQKITVLPNVAHGIETSNEAMSLLANIITNAETNIQASLQAASV